jgi:hypothetical protein
MQATSTNTFKAHAQLSNASKHMSLSKASTQATHITNTSSIESKWGKAVWGASKFGRGVVVIDDGGTKIDFENTAEAVIAYWEDMLKSMDGY